jgi:hypothetical protein
VILFPRAVHIHFAAASVNLRKSFDGLSNEVRAVLKLDPLSGHVFVFLNRRRNQVEASAVDARRFHDGTQAPGGWHLLVPAPNRRRGSLRPHRRARAVDAASRGST